MRDHAGEGVHQRRFTGAVLAEQRMDLAGPHIEIDVVQRVHAWEGFAYAFGRQDRRRAQSRLLRCGERGAPARNIAGEFRAMRGEPAMGRRPLHDERTTRGNPPYPPSSHLGAAPVRKDLSV
jgi:hypothetical protein